ncbi:sporulation protein YhbH [Tumebacillus sp. ITR2]|uniref:Sporulation protein YhbH n=1 Tax=Tumebacillus amylolyticus TaxID=2801339 RepID=A0ABS1J7E8_9BACL|nr:sporulation protein YhbH [Tumebacillus amylolyticus]MBL0386193.1 sporulation protein YhbH [Tumebacillus amylolyticus]
MIHRPSFILSREDWSLHRKGEQDQQRHQEKVREAIKKNLADLVTEESLIMHDGRQIVKVPIRSLDEYRFRYNYGKGQHGGQGDGESQVGDVLGKDPSSKQQAGPGKGEGAGEQPGVDYYEAEVSLAEIENLLFADLELPNLQRKQHDEVTTTDVRFNDIRKKGLAGNIDKKRTLVEAIRRNSLAGNPGLHNITNDDLRYKTWEEVQTPHSQAVVLAMMDTSGSMGQFEKYIARSFFFWMTRFLKTKYEHVDIQFIAHHTEAKVVTEHEFFTKGESGGTICSSAYNLALNLIHTKYNPDRYNIYPFHFSDGDNLTSDNDKCIKLIKQLMDVSNIFGYGEVNQYNRSSSLMNAYKNIQDEKFKHAIIREKGEVYKALCHFFTAKDKIRAS